MSDSTRPAGGGSGGSTPKKPRAEVLDEKDLLSWKPENSAIKIHFDIPAGAGSAAVPEVAPASGAPPRPAPAGGDGRPTPRPDPEGPPPAARPRVPAVASGPRDREFLFALLRKLGEAGGTDLHVKAGLGPYYRRKGRIRSLGEPPVPAAQLLSSVAAVTTRDQMDRYMEHGDLDLSVTVQGTGRFRINVLRSRGAPGIVARIIPGEVPTLSSLKLPSIVGKLAQEPSGLLLVAGPTGSGKSTTLAVILDHINSKRPGHIVTLEDPIEFLHTDRASTVTQRQIGIDVPTFAEGIRFAQKMDPDVIMVGELRDLESVQAAFAAARAGKLVLATVHSNSAPKTIERIVFAYPTDEQSRARNDLSQSLLAILSQTLVRTTKGSLAPAVEILIANTAVRKAIRDEGSLGIRRAMESASAEGMITMEQALAGMVREGRIARQEALDKAPDPDLLVQFL